MSQPLVSILAPVYNSMNAARGEGAPLLPRALDSLLAQSFRKLEIVILDNQSDDGTAEVCQAYAARDPRVRCVQDSRKRPVEEAITRLTEIMTGDAAMIANDDDEYHPDYVRKMVESLDRDPQADMAWSNAWYMTTRGERRNTMVASPEEAYPASRPALANYCDYIQRRNPVPIIFGLFRAEALRRILPYEAFDEIGANADNLFMARFFLRGLRAVYLDEPLFFYRWRPRPLNPARMIGVPGLDQPLLIWLCYVRHQMRFHRRLCQELRQAGLPDLQQQYARAATLQTFVQYSRHLLESQRTDRMLHSIRDRLAWRKIWWHGLRRIRWMLGDTFPLTPFDRIEPALARLQPEVVLEFCTRSRERIRAMGGWADYAAGLIGAAKSEYVTDLHALLDAEDANFAADETAIRSALPRRAAILAHDCNGELYAGVRADAPVLSVFSCSRNLAPLLEETLRSVGRQSFQGYEHIVVDAASTDGSLDILKRYPKVRWISEPDGGVLDGLWKGLRMARGKFIMQCCVSDGYLDPGWFARCVKVLESDPQVSLVWGFPQDMSEDSWLGRVSYPQWQHRAVPQKTDWLAHWLESAFWFPEGNFCARREVFERCLPPFREGARSPEPFLEFCYRFNAAGYLPWHIPIVANFGRQHRGQIWSTEVERGAGERKLADYLGKVRRYRRRLVTGTAAHVFRDGEGNALNAPVPLRWIRRRYARTTARDVIYGLRNGCAQIIRPFVSAHILRLRRGRKP